MIGQTVAQGDVITSETGRSRVACHHAITIGNSLLHEGQCCRGTFPVDDLMTDGPVESALSSVPVDLFDLMMNMISTLVAENRNTEIEFLDKVRIEVSG
ncbi:DELTA-actitoxin-Aas1a [Trichinella pseudospiralis]